MTKVAIAGRDYDIAPYKIAQLRKAAPFIEKVNATAGSLSSIEGAVEVMGDLVGFLAVGIAKIDPSVTVDQLEEEIGFDDLPAIQRAFLDIMAESGFKPGEAKAASDMAEPEAA